jgi:hypothetical protein
VWFPDLRYDPDPGHAWLSTAVRCLLLASRWSGARTGPSRTRRPYSRSARAAGAFSRRGFHPAGPGGGPQGHALPPCGLPSGLAPDTHRSSGGAGAGGACGSSARVRLARSTMPLRVQSRMWPLTRSRSAPVPLSRSPISTVMPSAR